MPRRLKPGEVDLHRRRQYWEHFEKQRVISDAAMHARYELGIRVACHLLVDQLKPDARSLKWAKEQAELLRSTGFLGAPDAAQKFFDEEAPKALAKFMEEGRKGRKVVREDENGPYKRTVWF